MKKAFKELIFKKLKTILLCFSIILLSFSVNASNKVIDTTALKQSEGFNPGEMIMHHIADAPDWHFFSIGGFHVSLPLPVLLYSSTSGFSVFLSSKFDHGHKSYNGYKLEHGHIVNENGDKFYNFSITKNVASMMLSGILLLLIFTQIGTSYIRRPKKAPKGIQSLLEPIILFIKEEVAAPILGEKHIRFLPFLLSVFFFIWINNLLGLLPGAANVTGNIAVTLTLALMTFLITNFSGNKNYWGHILNPPGLPKWLLPLMIVVEFIGIFTKPFALMIRLFANITAGHIIILSIISLIFIFGNLSPIIGYAVSPVSLGFAVFLFGLELLVAVLQAYIFTMLSAVFIGQAIEEHHHDKSHGDSH